jgi:signal peptidase II
LAGTVVVLAVLLDQATKWLVRRTFAPLESRPIIDGLLSLTHVRNEGAAFGLMPGNRTLFVMTSVLVIIAIVGFSARVRPRSGWLVMALALLAGGAFGNLIDRVVVGRVTDFIDVAVVDFPVFNVADSCIVIGVGMLMIWVLFGPEPGEIPEKDAELSDAAEHNV